MNLRPELAQHLSQRLQAFGEGFRHNLALIGPPGSGKTFQLQQLLSEASERFLVLYCPLYRESCRSFLRRLLAAILHSGLQAARGREGVLPLPQSFEALLAHAQPRLPKTVAAIAPIDALLSRRLYGEAFNRSLDAMPVVVQECGRPAVLMLDEFLFLEEMGLGHAFHELGKRVMTWPSVLFVLSSSSPYRARMILRERLQLLFGQFELLTLGAPQAHTTGAWVAREMKGLRGRERIVPFLLHWLGGWPWYLSVVLKRLREVACLEGSREVTDALFIEAVWDVLGRPEGPMAQWCASRVEAVAHARHGGRAVEALMHIAHGARTATELGRRIGRAGLPEALQRLVEQDVAQRNGTCWVVADPLLRCWLSTVFLAQRADARPEEAQLRRQLDAYVQALWMRWLQARRLSFPEQVAALFNRFHDDMVFLDAKAGRLPRFERITAQPGAGSPSDTYLVAEAEGKRWCATIREAAVDEQAIAAFEGFCRAQLPRPSRKVVITKAGMDEHARVLAKTANMWVWQGQELDVLATLYGNE
ncbi:MAG: ATP-binding protein [Candidatus Omnitrophica bacterium]|nr:ATP-binding protein [Candidatus Omnitrophota bacterium]